MLAGKDPESECVPSPPSETLPPDAIASAELDDNRPNKYGKFEASIKYLGGAVISFRRLFALTARSKVIKPHKGCP